jgi:dolichol-phosphate mannosyltransferase
LFNESSGLTAFIQAIAKLRQEMPTQTEIRLLLVNDGSTDDSAAVIRAQENLYPWLSHLSLSGNYGHQAALIAGLSSVDDWAQAIVTMDSDLEHPPEKITEMLQLYRASDCVLVHGIREENTRLSLQKRLLSKLFYLLTSALTGLRIVPGQADFCLWDARLIRELKPYLNSIGSLRVFASWVPGPKTTVSFKQNIRAHNKSRYTFGQNWNLALNSIIRFSNTPLRFITWLGFLGVGVSLLHLVQIALAIYQHEPLQPGWPTLIITVIFMGCLQLICLGILASYLRRLVFSKDLPLFLVKEDRRFRSENSLN